MSKELINDSIIIWLESIINQRINKDLSLAINETSKKKFWKLYIKRY